MPSYRFGPFDFDPNTGRLLKSGTRIRLQRKPQQLLQVLLQHAGEPVSRELLRAHLWPNDAYRDFETGLNVAVKKLRDALCDSADEPSYVFTEVGVGYRFIAAVEDPAVVAERRGYRFIARTEFAPKPYPTSSEVKKDSPGQRAGSDDGLAGNNPRAYGGNIADKVDVNGPGGLTTPRSSNTRPGAWWAALLVSTGILIFVGSIIWIRFTSAAKPMKTPRLVPFTSSAGDKRTPAFSPNGNELVFAWQGENGNDPSKCYLYVQLVGGGTPVRITHAAAFDWWPTWSPDGSFVAFERDTSEGSAYYIVPALGGVERKLIDKHGGGYGVSWSGNGKYLAIVDRPIQEPKDHILLVSVESGESQDSNIRPSVGITTGLAFSPDGKYLAFARGSAGNSDLFIVPVTGGTPRIVASVHSSVWGLAWTPDSQEIVFGSTHQGLLTLWRSSLNRGEPELVPAAAEYATQPAISTRGNRLAFLHSVVRTGIWKKSLTSNASQDAELVSSMSENSQPSLSPDGRRLAFQSSRSGSFETYVSDIDGLAPMQLTNFQTSSTVALPAWSPDGKMIAVQAQVDGYIQVFLCSSEGAAERRLTSGPYLNEFPNWSHDGKWIYFTSNRSGTWQAWKVPVQGGDPLQITTGGAVFVFESWDGKSLYYWRDKAVWNLDLATNRESRIVDSAPDWVGGWRLCGKGICAVDRTKERFITYDPSGRIRQTIPLNVGPSAGPFRGFDVTPDGQWLLYTRIDSMESNIMMIENFQ
jgi:Tol biopolymer transport system component/DNA-binding winged helix-turn-helix (wHTH) protein